MTGHEREARLIEDCRVIEAWFEQDAPFHSGQSEPSQPTFIRPKDVNYWNGFENIKLNQYDLIE